MDNCLIIGGAGYIGSHLAHYLKSQNINPVILDDLSTGFKQSIKTLSFINADYRNQEILKNIISSHKITTIFHLASRSIVSESIVKPDIYYQHNVAGILSLLETLKQYPEISLIFSSTAAIYGNPEYLPIDEKHLKNPINPYGKSKWIIEQILMDYYKAYNIKYGVLRYFNAAGAAIDASNGEMHQPETHLIPLIIQVASNRKKHINIYGSDYPTIDGTAMRDYIHVQDLASAHLLLASKLMQSTNPLIYNVGSGKAVSVWQILQTAQKITSQNIKYNFIKRRDGDPHSLLADINKIQTELKWKPEFSDIETIISHSWKWEKNFI